ncbi:amino acid permease [Candidatus Poribacteria bacterium]|nr:amino acid permease [Candidatus Poribacteria bacterium]
MGRDRNFPTFFSKVHAKNFTPHWGILVSLVIIVLMVISLPIEAVAAAADIMFLLLFLQVNIAMIRLRKKRPDLDRGFITPLYPWLSIVGIGLLLFLALYMFNYSPIAWVITVIWVALGLGVYKVYASKREVEHIRRVTSLERLERKEYRILVCLSKPESVKSLASVAIPIAKKHNAEIICLHVIEVREGQPLLAGLEDQSSGTPLLDEAEAFIAASDVPVRSILKVSHRLSQGIVETAEEENCNFIILGRQKQPTFFERFFSSAIDTVIQKAPCEVAVLHGEIFPERVRNIFIPFSADIHTRLATEIAPAFVENFNSKLQVGIVFEPEVPLSQRDEQIHQVEEFIRETALPATLDVVKDRDVLQGVLQQSRDADLILMGGRTGDFLELLLGKSLAQEITEQSTCPVLWVKEYEERESFWASLFKPYGKVEEQHG